MTLTLIADDDVVSSKILEKNLKNWGYKVIIAKDGQEAWKILQKRKIKLAILDWMMPKIDGIEICQKLRSNHRKHYTYIILLTSKDQKKDIIKGLNSGADDYIKKPFEIQELQARLKTGKRVIELEEKLIKAKKEFEKLANKDGLTDLWNRRHMLEILEKEIHRSQREKQPVATIMVDIDKFKHINDSFGHNVGDQVLLEISKRLRCCIRDYDEIGRYGGDELLIVLTNRNLKNAAIVAERLRKTISDKKIQTYKGLLDVSISLGVASSEKQIKYTSDCMILASDNALLEAKEKGRNRVCIKKLSSIKKEKQCQKNKT
jgi:diguanylate cyclase (GGDEF)-like protein